MKIKKKQMILLFLLLLIFFSCSCLLLSDDTGVLSNEDFIRFHVVANSNSQQDQQLKLLVRDRLLHAINEGLVAEAVAAAKPDQNEVTLDIDRSKEYIHKNLTELEKEAGDALSSADCNYPVKAELGITFIPQKSYGDIIFPAGKYNALTVTIGEGRGENWWCVLFPPLCLIGQDPGDLPGGDDFYKEAMLDDKYRTLSEEHEKPIKLKLKFKVLELFSEKG